MPWLELQLTIDAATRPRVESALEELGALSLTLMDADVDTPDEAAVLEPGVGETPLWKSVSVLALFPADAERQPLLAALATALPGLAPGEIRFREVADRDWQRAWMDRYRPMRFGKRLWVYPSNIEPPEERDVDSVIVRLDPGLAFGTGTHPTTALCLEWLDGLEWAGATVIDYGCGSGVLAIAALKLGAARAMGVDNDPQALAASHANAERNGVRGGRLSLHSPTTVPAATSCNGLVANILSQPLLELVPRFAMFLEPGAPFALSGILAGQEPDLLERCRASGLHSLRVVRRGDWVRIDGRHP